MVNYWCYSENLIFTHLSVTTKLSGWAVCNLTICATHRVGSGGTREKAHDTRPVWAFQRRTRRVSLGRSCLFCKLSHDKGEGKLGMGRCGWEEEWEAAFIYGELRMG